MHALGVNFIVICLAVSSLFICTVYGTKEEVFEEQVQRKISSVAYFPLKDDLFANLAFVHLTEILPADGIMKPGATYNLPNQKKVVIEQGAAPRARITLHHCCNSTVESHSHGKWDKCRYAIIEPASAYRGEAYGGHLYDIFSVGPHILSKEAIIILPEEEIKSISPGYSGSLISYKQGERALKNIMKQEVIKALEQKGYKPIPFTKAEKIPSASVGGQNINSYEFLEHLFKKENLWWGLHGRSRFSSIEKLVSSLYEPFRVLYVNQHYKQALEIKLLHPKNARELLIILDHELKVIKEEEIKSFSPLSGNVKGYISGWREELSMWKILLNLELTLRDAGKSFFSDTKALLALLPLTKENLSKLFSIYHERTSKNVQMSEIEIYDPFFLFKYSLPYLDRKTMEELLPKLKRDNTNELYLYAFSRFILIIFNDIVPRESQATQELEEIITKCPASFSKEEMKIIDNNIFGAMEKDHSKALNLLNDKIMRGLVSKINLTSQSDKIIVTDVIQYLEKSLKKDNLHAIRRLKKKLKK